MNALAEAMRTELHGLETLLHRLTTLRLMMATGKQRSIERAAAELEIALDELTRAETARNAELGRVGFTRLADAVAVSDEPLRSDLTLTGGRLQQAQHEVRVAASATSSMASRSLTQVQHALREAGAIEHAGSGAPWRAYGPASGGSRPGRVGFIDGDL